MTDLRDSSHDLMQAPTGYLIHHGTSSLPDQVSLTSCLVDPLPAAEPPSAVLWLWLVPTFSLVHGCWRDLGFGVSALVHFTVSYYRKLMITVGLT